MTNLLQKAAVNIIDQADCQQAYANVLTPNMMCAGHMEGGRDTCLVRARRRHYCEAQEVFGLLLIGLVSFYPLCENEARSLFLKRRFGFR